MTYREMWETYVEPNLKAQAELDKARGTPNVPSFSADDEPMTVDRKVAEAQAMGFMFGADPLEVGKAVRKSWPIKPADIDVLRAKLAAREKAPK